MHRARSESPLGVRATCVVIVQLSINTADAAAFARIRGALGLTQAELAARLGISRNAVASWECGRSRPTKARLAELVQMAQATQKGE